ncbi:hypothetical protein [Kitasatospora sp. LaBMicrA B282]|uniref:hypothetical protein n=1 Tax=Kitasatospora sp. LaBMicrA B282 TaxID=3420949 RepID=UPI003D0B5CA1
MLRVGLLLARLLPAVRGGLLRRLGLRPRLRGVGLLRLLWVALLGLTRVLRLLRVARGRLLGGVGLARVRCGVALLRLARVLRLLRVARLRLTGVTRVLRVALLGLAGVLRLAGVLGVAGLLRVPGRGRGHEATTLRSCWNAV